MNRRPAISSHPGTGRANASVTVEDEGVRRYTLLLEERVKRGELDSGTARAYLSDVRAFAQSIAEPAGATATLTATPEAVARYFGRVVAERSASTARRKLASLRSFYGSLQEHGLVTANPTQHLQPPPLRRSAPLRKPIQASVMKKLLAAPTRETPKGLRDRALLILLALYGLPVIEVHRLNAEDVDLRAARLRVVGRGRKPRFIELAPGTTTTLQAWLTTRTLLAPQTPALFVSLHWTRGRSEPLERLSVRGIRQVVDGHLMQIDAKRPGRSCHSLRRACVALAVEAGADPAAVAKSIGQSSVASIQHYIDHLPSRRGESPAHYLSDLVP